ncbi:MAG TPA: HRDC domain-containing protein [Gemmataceae bacterium]|nr:HRDC domain-containing protein [Gemmataceae bacterium]
MAQLREEIVTHPEDLAACCVELAKCEHFGFDTEFVGEDTYHPSLCLVQVATPDCLYLIDPLTAGPLDAFWQLVVDPARVVVVHAGREEVRLCRLWTGHTPGNLFDLQLAAGLAGLAYPLGHGTLVHQVLGVQMTKGETLTEWRHRPLTSGQIRYAFDDVRYLLPVWRRLSARLEKGARLDWAKEEFVRLAANAAPDEPATEKWRKLRGLGSLDRRRLAIVRALYNWREETAARTNRPTRAIVRDDLIIEIARRNPARERDLQVVRGLPRRDLDAIVETVTEARNLPLEACPIVFGREQDPPQLALVANVLTAVLGDVCARLGLAANLVASSNDVKLLVRARLAGQPLPSESLLTAGWRSAHILPELLAVLDGRRLLRIADIQAEAPLAYTDALNLPASSDE